MAIEVAWVVVYLSALSETAVGLLVKTDIGQLLVERLIASESLQLLIPVMILHEEIFFFGCPVNLFILSIACCIRCHLKSVFDKVPDFKIHIIALNHCAILERENPLRYGLWSMRYIC